MSRTGVKKGKVGPFRVNVQMIKDKPLKPQRVEPLVKEEGEMSDDEEVYEKFKEEKWMEWCEEMMASEIKTLNRLHRLQTTSANLPKEKVHLSLHCLLCQFCFPYHLFHARIVLIIFCVSGAFKNSQLFTASWTKDRSNCSGQ